MTAALEGVEELERVADLVHHRVALAAAGAAGQRDDLVDDAPPDAGLGRVARELRVAAERDAELGEVGVERRRGVDGERRLHLQRRRIVDVVFGRDDAVPIVVHVEADVGHDEAEARSREGVVHVRVLRQDLGLRRHRFARIRAGDHVVGDRDGHRREAAEAFRRGPVCGAVGGQRGGRGVRLALRHVAQTAKRMGVAGQRERFWKALLSVESRTGKTGHGERGGERARSQRAKHKSVWVTSGASGTAAPAASVRHGA